MKSSKPLFIGLSSLFLSLIILSLQTFGLRSVSNTAEETSQKRIKESIKRAFIGFRTDLNKRSIELNQILDGGPGKDGIPAIHNPKFIPREKANLRDDVFGVLVESGDVVRYYPYNILVWHEIVNDSFGGMDIAVTFCPLCGSAIVFNRRVEGQTLRFGVSGKLYESNLLMYDDRTESLWSQSRGEAVVGDYTGTKLELVKMQLLPFKTLKSRYPQALILSDKTGHFRDYSLYPYENYNDTEDLYFPVNIHDNRFSAKELMYVFIVDDKYVAFPAKSLGSERKGKNIEGKKIEVEFQGGEIKVYVDGQMVPGYYEMWFSWATHHQKDGIVWKMKN